MNLPDLTPSKIVLNTKLQNSLPKLKIRQIQSKKQKSTTIPLVLNSMSTFDIIEKNMVQFRIY